MFENNLIVVGIQFNKCIGKKFYFEIFGYIIQFEFYFRGAELYAQNPNLIKKDENRIRADEADHQYSRQSTLPLLPTTQNDFSLNRNASLDL